MTVPEEGFSPLPNAVNQGSQEGSTEDDPFGEGAGEYEVRSRRALAAEPALVDLVAALIFYQREWQARWRGTRVPTDALLGDGGQLADRVLHTINPVTFSLATTKLTNHGRSR